VILEEESNYPYSGKLSYEDLRQIKEARKYNSNDKDYHDLLDPYEC
jgi:hypothetical protein